MLLDHLFQGLTGSGKWCELDGEQGVLQTSFHGEYGVSSLTLTRQGDDALLIFCCTLDLLVQRKYRNDICSCIQEANTWLAFGKFVHYPATDCVSLAYEWLVPRVIEPAQLVEVTADITTYVLDQSDMYTRIFQMIQFGGIALEDALKLVHMEPAGHA